MWEARLSLPQRPGGASRPFYHYWTRKARGKTVGLKLTEDELGLYREWIENNRELERLVKEMRRSSSRVLALNHRQAGSMNPRVSGSPATVAVTAILRTLRPVR